MTFTIIADSNISHLNDYFNSSNINIRQQQCQIIPAVGRAITAQMLQEYKPQALLVRSVTHINSDLLADNTSVQFVGSATIGTDHIDRDYLQHRDICFAHAAGCSKHSVAQYVLTAIMQLRPQYRLNEQLNKQQSTLSSRSNPSHKPAHTPAHTPIIGIIGLGNIGSTLAKYAQSLGWTIVGYDPMLPKDSINNASLDELLAAADIISIHVPLTHNKQSRYPTYHLLDDQAFALMKKDSILINTARGAVVTEQALIRDIKKTAREVVLDVFEYEPIVSQELLSVLTLATPHIAGYTLEGKLRGTQLIYEAFCQYFDIAQQQSMYDLLPINPYQWQHLQQDWAKLTDYYDILADNNNLKSLVAHGETQVEGVDFDGLRKNYALRREWL